MLASYPRGVPPRAGMRVMLNLRSHMPGPNTWSDIEADSITVLKHRLHAGQIVIEWLLAPRTK